MGTLARTAGIAALAVLALVAAGCGGGSPNGSAVANIGTTSATDTAPSSAQTPTTAQEKQATAYAFSKCMRANGVPNFPDPSTSGGIELNAGSGLDPNSPQFQKAQTKCQKLLPNGGRPSQQQIAKAEQQALAFSKCMRSHGVPNFPDPQFSTNGGFGVRVKIGGPGSGLDPNSPTFQRAQQACAKVLPGLKVGVRASPGSGASSGGKP